MQDITERKKIDQELKRWAEIFQNVAFGFVIGTPNSENLGLMNPAFARMHGYTEEELTGTPIANVFAPEDRAELPEHIRVIHKKGHHTWEANHVRKDGTGFPVMVDAVAVKDDSGQVLYRIVSVQDISDRKKAEVALKHNESLLNEMGKIAMIGAWELDTATMKQQWTDETYVIHDCERGVYNPNSTEEISRFEPGSKEKIEKAFNDALNKGIPYDLDLEMITVKGNRKWVRAVCSPLVEDGKVTRLVGAVQDITHLKEVEENRRIALQKYQTLFNTFPLGITVADQDGMILESNRIAEHLLGLSEAEQKQREIDGAEWRVIRPDGTPMSAEEFASVRALKEKTIVPNVEMGIVKQDESVTWIEVTAAPLPLEGYGVVATYGDISQRKELENQLKENERNYRELVQNANSAIIRWDKEGKVRFINEFAQNFFGYSAEEIVGKPVSILVPDSDSTGSDLSNLVTNIAKHPESNIKVLNENICRDGRRVWMTWTNKPVYDAQGDLSEILAVGIDITESKKMEDELRRSNAELEQFAYVASHDLQEPLRTVAGMVTLLQRRYQGQLDKRADEYIGYAVDASDRMQQLINDLLDFSRVERKGKPFENTDTEAVFQNVLANLQTAIIESGANITHDPLPVVQADAGQLTRVLQNLVGNAIKFRGTEMPKIHIKTDKIDSGWQFSVRDNGLGIDPQYFERVFQLFQRLHTRQKYPGTGIGLALCKKIIERHGGKIWIESELNHGSTFIFTLPERG